MKNLIKLLSLLTVIGFIVTSCEGPMGPAGKDANESCILCHNTANMSGIETQFETSDKNERTARPGKYCAKCHSTEGFSEVVAKGTFVTANDYNGAHLTCTACHKHSAFDFSGDTISQVLRTVAPVYTSWNNFNYTTMAYAKTNASDYGSTNNLCANCHQYRGQTAVTYTDTTTAGGRKTPVSGTGTITYVKYTNVPYFPIVNTGVTTATVKYRAGTSFGLHEGANQPDYLIGKNGYEYTGVTYTRTWKHSNATCTECHFNAYDATSKTGGHTMKVNVDDPACTSCHNGGSTIAAKRTATLAAINAKLTELGNLLVARKVFFKSSTGSFSAVPTHDFYGTLLPNTATATTTIYALSATTANFENPTSSILTYNSNVAWAVDKVATSSAAGCNSRIGREWKEGELGAAWNFTYVNTVATTANVAVHNPAYALQLLQKSIDWLNANP
jgi:nitrate/TMAO reductase-like tetraheme cytochrome c subunit